MSPRFASLLTSLFATAAVLLAPPAAAAPAKVKASSTKPKPDKAPDPAPEPTPEPVEPAKPAEAPEAADEVAKEPSADAEQPESKETSAESDGDASSPVELADKTYLGVGLRYRAIVVPKFMMNLFGDGGRTVVANGIGPEFTIRKNNFEYELSALFTSYAMDPTPFKASSDPPEAWEIVQSKLKVLYLTADFVWSRSLSPEFALNYGAGAGFGFVWGDLLRTQAYPGNGNDPKTGEGFLPCTDQFMPNNVYCGKDNNHYKGYSEPSWASGGSKPIIFPWLAVQTGFRYKPHKNFIARFDAGFGTSGFFLGLGADYGL